MSKPIATNRQAWYNYFISDKYEAGIALEGTEVKSLRDGRVTLKDSFVRVVRGEAFVFNLHIPPYRHTQSIISVDPTRTRKLLLHCPEIEKLTGWASQKGHTIVPLSIYFKRGRAKLEIGCAQGKKLYDKREVLKRKTAEREIERELRVRQRKKG